MRDFYRLILLGVCMASSPMGASSALAVSMIVNEFNAVGDSKFLDTDTYNGSLKEDIYFKTIPGMVDGRLEGNGGNWVEFVIVEDHVDIRGWTLEWEESFYDEADVFLGRRGGVVTFSPTASVLSDLRRGTILTVGEKISIGVETDMVGSERQLTDDIDPADVDLTIDMSTDMSFNPIADDWWMHISTRDEAGKTDPLVTTVVNNPANYDGPDPQPGDFSVTNDDWEITIFDASHQKVFGPVGEDTDAWFDSGVSSNEVGKLEEDPTNQISDQGTSRYFDGESSSFGQPNVWTDNGLSFEQNFAALRDGLTFTTPGDYNQDGKVDAADYVVWRNSLGSTTELAANGDDTGASAGVVDQADYVVWKNNFGVGTTSASLSSPSNVPEPCTAGLLLAAIGWVTGSRIARPRS